MGAQQWQMEEGQGWREEFELGNKAEDPLDLFPDTVSAAVSKEPQEC